MPPTPRRSSRPSRALPVALAAGLIAAGAAVPPAAAGVTSPAQVPTRIESSQTVQDPTGDAHFAQGDLASAGASAAANGIITLVVTVDQYESPLSDNWQLALTDVTWDIDLDGDGALDDYVVMIGVGGEVLAGVFEDTDGDGPSEDDDLLCDAETSYSASLESYSAIFPTACIGSPASFRWAASMTFEHHVTEVQSFDSAPDTGWAGPVTNSAYVPCMSGPSAPAGPPADGFVSLVPARLLDTRAGQPTIDCRFSGTGRIGGVVESHLEVAGRGGVPLDAIAVVLNVTATDAVAAGYVSVYPCGTQRPFVSNLNYLIGSTVPNAVIATIGEGGTVCLFSSASAHLIVDVNGYFTAASSFVTSQLGRAYDSRVSGPRVPASTVVSLGIPGGGSSGVFNVTVSDPLTAGYATVFPCDSERPLASNLNFRAGDTVANLVIAKGGAGGHMCVYLSTSAHLIVDTFGYFQAAAGFRTVLPARLLETRPGLSTVDGVSSGIGLRDGPVITVLQVAGRGSVPPDASAAVLNVTVDDARAEGFITVFPCDSPQPLTSNLNYLAGSTVPNLVISKIAADGTVCLFTNADTHLVVDVNGYFPAPS